MEKQKKEKKNFISKKWGTFKKSKTLVFILGLIIGSTTIYIYLVGSQYLKWVNEGLRYTIDLNRVSAEVLPHEGEVAQAGSLQEASLTIPAKGSIEELIAQYFGTETETALKIARCENDTLDPLRNNTHGNYPNNSTDRGIFMLNDHWHDEVSDECAYDARCNIENAHRIFKERGWDEWACNNLIK